MASSWQCHAHPASLKGKTCGHNNTTGINFNGLTCCESCGCTKKASDDRAAIEAEKGGVK